jgi:membrane protease YdiL (CAAX protease family)
MNKKRWYSIFFLICVCLFLSSIPFNYIIKNEIALFCVNSVLKIIAIIFLFYYAKKENFIKPKLDKLNKYHILILPFFVIAFSNYIVVLFNKTTINTSINTTYLLMGAFTSLLTAILEELLFRNILLDEFINQTNNKIKSLIYSSLIFGGIHLLNISSLASIPICIVQAIYTTGIGLVFGLIYIKTKNITYPVIIHFLFNYINDTLVTHLYNINWNLSFFIINISVGIIIGLYSLLIYKINFKGE